MKNVKGRRDKNWLAKEREREREREMVMVRNGDRKIFETDKTETVWTKSVCERWRWKKMIDWVLIWTNLQNKNVLVRKRYFELWKRACLFKLKKLKILKRGQNIHTKTKTCQKWYVIFTNLNKNGRGIKIDSFWKPGVFNWILVWENKTKIK